MSLGLPRPRPLASVISSLLNLGRKTYSTSPQKKDERGESLLEQGDDDSSWDHIFANIDEDVAISRKHIPPERNLNKRSLRFSATSASEPDATTRYSRRAPMTAYEKNAFDSMFDMIFKAATQRKENFTTAAVQLPLRRTSGWSWLQRNLSSEISSNNVESQVNSPSVTPDVLPFPSLPLGTYGRLRNLPKRTTELDKLLDEKKEEISLCHSDLEVLEWAVRELFGEADLQGSSISPNQAPLPPVLYAPLLAYLMQYFTSRPHQNYHTALALFTYAKTLSPTSYVFGCSTPAYNIYLRALWTVEQNSSEILAVLQEMHANGVSYDTDTKRILEEVRRDIEERWRNSKELFADDSSCQNETSLNPFLYLEKAEQLIHHRRKMRFSPTHDDQSHASKRQAFEEGEDRLLLI